MNESGIAGSLGVAYVALAGSADRLAAVYVLSSDDDAESIALGRVSVIDLTTRD